MLDPSLRGGVSDPFFPAENNEPYMKIPCSDSKITSAVWGPLGEFIIAGHESGELNQFSAKVGAWGSTEQRSWGDQGWDVGFEGSKQQLHQGEFK